MRQRETQRRLADAQYHASQREFAETLQVTENEGEAHALVKRHLERSLGGSEIVVLNRNNSQNRLEAATPVPPGEPDRREARRLLAQLVPRRAARPDARAVDRRRAAAHLRSLQPARPHDVRPLARRRRGDRLGARRPRAAAERVRARPDRPVGQPGRTGARQPPQPRRRRGPRRHRRADRPAERAQPPREPRPHGRAGVPFEPLALRGALRPRPLQADQRRLRAREGRPGAGRGERRAQVVRSARAISPAATAARSS